MLHYAAIISDLVHVVAGYILVGFCCLTRSSITRMFTLGFFLMEE